MKCRNWLLGGCALLILATGQTAMAQETDTRPQGVDAANQGDIIVTARRRDETAQETPVALTVLNADLLDRYGVRGVQSIQSLTPGLYTGESSGAMGGTISLRGIGSGDSMAFIDQAVSANVDGVPISSAQILRADGPQADRSSARAAGAVLRQEQPRRHHLDDHGRSGPAHRGTAARRL
jgi:iron complex outermembrane recepter protein